MRKYTPDFANTIPAEAQSVFKGEIFEIFQWPQKLFDGSVRTFEMARRPDTVKILAVKDDKIVIVKQRQPRMDWYYDIPSGRHDNPSESELDAAKRELLEETGMSFKTWKLIDVKQPFIKMDWLVYTFLATDFEGQVAQRLDGGEDIEVMEVSFADLQKIAKKEQAVYLKKDELLTIYQSLPELLAAKAIYEY